MALEISSKGQEAASYTKRKEGGIPRKGNSQCRGLKAVSRLEIQIESVRLGVQWARVKGLKMMLKKGRDQITWGLQTGVHSLITKVQEKMRTSNYIDL